MALKGYHSYRGRQGAWRWLLAIVLVLVLIAACAFLMLQRYIVYRDDGSFYLDLPFEINWEIPLLNGGENAGDKQDEPGKDVNLVVDPPQEQQPDATEENPDQEQETGQETGQEQPVAETYIARRLIAPAQLPQDEAALDAMLEAAGADGFVFQAKDRDGVVYYQSAVAISEALSADGVSRELLTRLCAREGVYTVARISCMRDPKYGKANMEQAGICKSNGFIWYENDAGGHWLDAEKKAARDYVISIAVECAELGFDELLLENVCYPYRGNLYKIDYSQNTMSKTDALVLFLTELEAALEPYGVNISLALEENWARGLAENTADTGFIPQRLLPMVDAVYVATNDEETVRREMKILLGGKSVPALVPVVNEPVEGDGWYIEG